MSVLRVAIVSDLHLETRRRHLARERDAAAADAAMAALQEQTRHSAAGADLVVVAGDVAGGSDGLRWAAATFGGTPAVYVAGNHEFYRHERHDLLRELRAVASPMDQVHFLEQDELRLTLRGRELRVLGCTAWTDYRLYGETGAGEAMRRAEAQMYDHRLIANGQGTFSAADARQLHGEARAWLSSRLAHTARGSTVVVTHHAPDARSIEPRFVGDSLSPAFASDLSSLALTYAPALWIHGHTHYNVDYAIGATRVVSHQWGYPTENVSHGCKVVEI
jgi:predicted phosphodiesterase